MLCLLLFASPTTALRPATTIDPCILYSDSPASVRSFVDEVWSPDRWRRGDPPAKTTSAWRLRQHCLPPGWQRALRKRWRELQAAFFDRRRAELLTRQLEPYVCGDRRYALPCAVTECESGYYFGHTSGAYGLLQSTWEYWGGLAFAGYPGAASPREQAIVATRVWEAVGPSGWECPL